MGRVDGPSPKNRASVSCTSQLAICDPTLIAYGLWPQEVLGHTDRRNLTKEGLYLCNYGEIHKHVGVTALQVTHSIVNNPSLLPCKQAHKLVSSRNWTLACPWSLLRRGCLFKLPQGKRSQNNILSSFGGWLLPASSLK